MNTMKVSLTIHADGTSLWSNTCLPKAVKVTGLQVNAYKIKGERKDTGILKVIFDTTTWDVNTDGLIYTDVGFDSELKIELEKLGFSDSGICNISYAEQGMQGTNTVTYEVGDKFLKEFRKISGLEIKAEII